MEQEDINRLKEMAMADGVLSENEKRVFRQYLDMPEEEVLQFFDSIEGELESVQSETEVIDWKRKNGLDFEKLVVSLLPDDYKNLRWTGDKYVGGRFDLNDLQPDITFDIELNGLHPVAIECKFRMGFYKDVLMVAKEWQLQRYREYEKYSNTPVYLAIGVGGSGAHPEEMYLVPLYAMKFPFAKREYLQKFKRDVDKKLFYYVKMKRLF